MLWIGRGTSGKRSAKLFPKVVYGRWVVLSFDDDIENRIEETAVFLEGSPIVGGDRGVNGLFRRRGDKFEAADEDSRELRWSGSNGEGKDRVDVLARDDVDQAASFFKPAVAPGCKHGVGFVGIEALRDEKIFKVAPNRVDRAADRRHFENGMILRRRGNVVADLVAAALEDDERGNRLAAPIVEQDCTGRQYFCGE